MNQKVVIVVGEGELRERLFAALVGSSAEAVEVPSVERALELASTIEIQLLVVRYPIENMKLGQLLERFSKAGCASRGAQVVVLAPGRSLGGLRRSVGGGVAVIRSDTDPEALGETFSTFLRRSPRFEENLLVQVDLELESGKVRKMLQVKNLSEGGMLLQMRTPAPVGTRLAFELGIPELKKPIAGKAEVVRVTDRGESSRTGAVGIKVVSYVGDSRDRLSKFLKVRRRPAAMAR